MTEITPSENDIFEIIRTKLNLSDSAVIMKEPILKDTRGTVEPDMVIEDGNRRFLVEIKSKINVDAIAHLVLLKEILQKQDKYDTNTYLVITAKFIAHDIEKIAGQVGVQLLTIPRNMRLPDHKTAPASGKVKVTSEKSWKIVSRLLKEKMTSIRQLSIIEGISYGWAHATVQSLISQGIVTKKGNYVTISDVNKLLNGISWERPFENLHVKEINVEYNDATAAARELSHMLDNSGIKFAFTGYTAGGLYTGYAVRHDSIYIYLEKDEIDLFTKTFQTSETAENKGIKVKIYAPDRGVYYDAVEKEGIRIVSPAQALLDLAGMGYSGMDITKAMVDKYGDL